jgi:Flp pilus assembly protein TadD
MNQADDPLRPRIRAIETAIAERRFDAAAAALDELRSDSPGDVRVHLAGALLASALRKPEEEIAALRRAVGLVPGWPLPRVELAKALARSGAIEEALAFVRAAASLAPTDLSVLETGVMIAPPSAPIARASSAA